MPDSLLKITTNQIKKNTSISNVLTHYGGECVNPTSGIWWCILHEAGGRKNGHKTPSLIAKAEHGTATCMSQGCFNTDDIFGIIAKMEKLSLKNDFLKIKKKACDISGIAYEQTNIHELNKTHLEYLESLGISKKTADTFELKARQNYILYPQITNNQLKGYKGISINKNTQKKIQFFEGSSATLFAEREKSGKHIILTEGEKDCLRLSEQIRKENQEDMYAPITTTKGAKNIPRDITEQIIKLKPRSISIIYDNDKAGYEGATKLAKHLVKHFDIVNVYLFPEETKIGYDISDFLNEGKNLNELFSLKKEIFKKQALCSLYQHYTLSEASILETLVTDEVLNTGYTEIDKICPIIRGENTIITGRTGKGKTTLGVNLINGILKNTANSKIIVFSLELKKKAFLQKLLSAKFDVETWKLKKGFTESSQIDEYLANAHNYIQSFQNRLIIVDDLHQIEQIEQLLNNFKQNFIPDYILIDYANILSFRNLLDTTKHIEISTWMKFFAKDRNIHIQAICQANRATKENDSGYAKTENLADSDQYGRDAFIVYSIKTSINSNTYYINPTKNRNGQSEKEIKLFWKPKSGKISQINPTSINEI